MISVSTIGQLNQQDYGLALYCIACDRWGEADLRKLVDVGLGARSITEVRFRCRKCTALVEKQVRPPVPELGGAVSYFAG